MFLGNICEDQKVVTLPFEHWRPQNLLNDSSKEKRNIKLLEFAALFVSIGALEK